MAANQTFSFGQGVTRSGSAAWAALGKEWGLPLGFGLGATRSLILQPGSHPRKAPLKHIWDAYHGPSLTAGRWRDREGRGRRGGGAPLPEA